MATGSTGSVRTAGICLKPGQPQAAAIVRGLEKWFAERGVETEFDEDAARCVGRPALARPDLAVAADLIVVLGGDGTLLSVARDAGRRRVPILGVNLGTLGFLTEVSADEVFAALERVLEGRARIEARMRLEVRLESGGSPAGPYLALNDAVISSAEMARMIHLDVRAGGLEVGPYHADGLIVSTPTGSTAYSLSAGGPILDANLEAIVLTPICSHTLTQRPIVLPASAQIELRAHPRGGRVRLTVDGQEGAVLQDGDRVSVRRSEHPVDLVLSPFRSRFEILRAKLHWGAR
jgi:NAD+ kinase